MKYETVPHSPAAQPFNKKAAQHGNRKANRRLRGRLMAYDAIKDKQGHTKPGSMQLH